MNYSVASGIRAIAIPCLSSPRTSVLHKCQASATSSTKKVRAHPNHQLHHHRDDSTAIRRPAWYVTLSIDLLAVCQHALGRQALAPNSCQPLRRFFASQVDHVEAAAQNSIKQLQSLESQINTHLNQPLPSFDPETSGTVPPSHFPDSISDQYHLSKQQREHSFQLLRGPYLTHCRAADR